MNRRIDLSLSASIAAKDARDDDLSASGAMSLHRLSLVIPALCALAYPFLLSLLSSGLVLVHGSASPEGSIVFVGVIGALTLALAVMLTSFAFGLAPGSAQVENPDGRRARGIAHLAFATPSLYVGFNNVAGVLDARPAVPVAWILFWALAAMTVLLGARTSSRAPAMSAAGHRRLAFAHGVSACAILLLFVGPHLVNHLAGVWNGPIHIEIMSAVRRVYRNDIVQPALLALIGFQILSGTALVRRRISMPNDVLGAVQTMAGVYVGIYFLAHMTAVFATRHAGTDTNWSWLTDPHGSMLVTLSNLRLLAHYWVGPIAIATHVACGLRTILLQHQVSKAVANRLAVALVAAAVIASSVILAALLNVHIA